jgi:hypothetical protein
LFRDSIVNSHAKGNILKNADINGYIRRTDAVKLIIGQRTHLTTRINAMMRRCFDPFKLKIAPPNDAKTYKMHLVSPTIFNCPSVSPMVYPIMETNRILEEMIDVIADDYWVDPRVQEGVQTSIIYRLYYSGGSMTGNGYIGRTRSARGNERLKEHISFICNALRGSGETQEVHRQIAKRGFEGLVWKVVALVPAEAEVEKESEYIRIFETKAPRGWNVCG